MICGWVYSMIVFVILLDDGLTVDGLWGFACVLVLVGRGRVVVFALICLFYALCFCFG